MKRFLIITALIGLSYLQNSSQSYQLPPKCNGHVQVRVAWSALSDQKKSEYIDAAVELNRRHGDTQYSEQHAKSMLTWHQGGFFFPVHRYFSYLYAQELLSINPNLVIPYWDWASDGNVLTPVSHLWDQCGQQTPNLGCIAGDKFQNYSIPNTEYTGRGRLCIRRQFDTSLQYQTNEGLSVFMQNTKDYTTFAYNMEIWHMVLHSSVGGELTTDRSPNDFIFFLLHFGVDKYFNDWLLMDPQTRLNQFNSMSPYKNGQPIDINSELPGFPGVKIGDVLNSLDLCYAYINPNVKFTNSQDFLKENFIPPPKFNATTIPKPSPVPENIARKLGWSQTDIDNGNKALDYSFQQAKQKLQNNEPINMPGTNTQTSTSTSTSSGTTTSTSSNTTTTSSTSSTSSDISAGFHGAEQLLPFAIDKFGRIPQNVLDAIIPHFKKASNGYTFGDGTFLQQDTGSDHKNGATGIKPYITVTASLMATSILAILF